LVWRWAFNLDSRNQALAIMDWGLGIDDNGMVGWTLEVATGGP
jgi:hypothetical protein